MTGSESTKDPAKVLPRNRERNLPDELLHRPAGAPHAVAPTCALSQNVSSCRGACGGTGFTLGRQGAFAHAELCSCVKTCPACYGTTRFGDKEGRSQLCRVPSPLAIVNRLNEAEIPARYDAATLAGFSNFSGNGADILAKCQRLVNQFRLEDGRGLLIGGGVGIGKTYLLAGLTRALCAKGVGVKFVDFFQLLGELRAAYSQDQSDLSILNPLIEVDVLVIDELGKGRNTDWELTILDQLIMGRYNQRKPIIASTNCPLTGRRPLQGSYNFDLEQMPRHSGGFAPDAFEPLETRVGQRIYSRLIEMCEFVEITGDDLRRKHQSITVKSAGSTTR